MKVFFYQFEKIFQCQVLTLYHIFWHKKINCGVQTAVYTSYYLNKSPRAVCRYYMTVDQILSKYNSELTESDKTKLRDELEKSYYTDNQKYIIRSTGPINAATTEDSEFATGILGGLEVTPVWDGNTGMYGYNNRLITVYEVEYILCS